MTGRCYYEILELKKSASDADIKKSYRKLALKWHPDKNPENAKDAEIRFKEISEAYEVLSDKSKREVYDRYGKEGLTRSSEQSSSGGRPNMHTRHDFGFDPFQGFGGMGGGLGGFGGGFHFRSPHEIFEEFFGTRNIFDIFEEGSLFNAHRGFRRQASREANGQHPTKRHRTAHGNHHSNLHAHQHSHPHHHTTNIMQSIFGFPHELGIGAPSGFTSFSSIATQPDHSIVKSTSKSTKVVNGKKFVTTKIIENGVETVLTEEDGILKSKTVNGVSQAIEFTNRAK